MNYLQTSFIVTTGLVKDKAYQFRVRAKNAYGFGSYSNIANIRTSHQPETMVTVTTAIQDQVKVRISWIKPYENSEPITAYKILIQ